jgi:predicted transcriptional regulator
MAEEQSNPSVNSLDIAREITVAWLGNPNVNAAASDVPTFLKAVHATISELANGPTIEPVDVPVEYVPAVPVRSSVKPDYIISLIDGRKFKTLKRHLALHGLTPGEYRERYGLKSDYPMVCASYSEHRREVARKLGLGRKPAASTVQEPEEAIADITEPTPAKPTRKPAKAGAVKAAAPKTEPLQKPIVSEIAEAAPASIATATIAGPAPKPAKAKRTFARPSTTQPLAADEDAVTSPAKPKKPRAAAKPKDVPNAEPNAEGGAEPVATTPKPRRSKKQVVEA